MSSIPWRGVASLLVLAALIVACLAIHPLRDALSAAAHGHLGQLRHQLRAGGVGGPLLLVGVVLAHTIVPFPAEIPTAVAGYVYGFAATLPLMAASFLASALIAYGLAQHLGRPAIGRLVGAERLSDGERLIERGGVRVLIGLRLIPLVPFSLVCAVAGLARVPLRRYAWTTVVGMTPQLILVSLFATRLQHPSASDPLLWSAAGGFLLLVLIGPPLLRRMRTVVA
jgi:uncharacterized membrane protein YdjX (TVP38/TMEM64 family)